MRDLLCEFAKRLPQVVADFLDKEVGKTKRFREETITDLIVASMTAFETFGVRVDFPVNETLTGEDMDWEFVDVRGSNPKKWTYLRLHMQAKRAKLSQGKKRVGHPYWYYPEIDHAVPGGKFGSQHDRLLTSSTAPGCVPLYIFYHPNKACSELKSSLSEIEGVNLAFAGNIKRNLSSKRWPRDDKKVAAFEKKLFKLSDVLCFGFCPILDPVSAHGLIAFLGSPLNKIGPAELIARQLNNIRLSQDGDSSDEYQTILPTSDIPSRTLRAILDRGSREEYGELLRPTVTFFLRDSYET